jgi:hypothetical protein
VDNRSIRDHKRAVEENMGRCTTLEYGLSLGSQSDPTGGPDAVLGTETMKMLALINA